MENSTTNENTENSCIPLDYATFAEVRDVTLSKLSTDMSIPDDISHNQAIISPEL